VYILRMAKKKTPNDKVVRIACKGAGTLAINLLTPLQGELKTLPDENYQRLKREIEADGFIEPISIWEDPKSGKVFVLNGHQRLEVLNRMKADGWKIPAVPVSYVEASNVNDAKRKILAMASQYGVVDQKALFDFTNDLGLSSDEIASHFSFADFDMDRFTKGFFPDATVIGQDVFTPQEETKEVTFTAKVKEKHGKECPKCGYKLED